MNLYNIKIGNMNRSYTKIRRIQEANILLENRFLLSEQSTRTDNKDNVWSIKQDPTSKKYRIFVKTFGSNDTDASESDDSDIKPFIDKGYFKDFNSESDAVPTLNQIVSLIGTTQTNNKDNNSTTTTTTLKPGETPSTSGSTETSGKTSYSDDDLIKSMTAKLQQQGYK